MSAVNPVNENLGSQLSHFFCGNVYGGQHGREILGGFDVIHTNDRNIFRNPVSFFPDGFDGPDGSIVIGTENGRYVGFGFHKMISSLVAAFVGKVLRLLYFSVKGQIQDFKASLKAV